MSDSATDNCTLCELGIRRTGDAITFVSGLTPLEQTPLQDLPRGPTRSLQEWDDFDIPQEIPINHPWLSRHSSSALLFFDGGALGSSVVHTQVHETCGNPAQPLAFRLGNGRGAHSGIVKALCESFIDRVGGGFCIEIVQNHARQTLVALLADVVQIAFVDEPHNVHLAVEEGWCEFQCTLLHDHGVLVGPRSDPASLAGIDTLPEALHTLVSPTSSKSGSNSKQMLFHSCGDGSATFYRKLQLWLSAGIDVSHIEWTKAYALDSVDALRKAARERAYIMTERSTYHVAKDQGFVPELRVYIEGDPALVAPCSVLINRKVAGHDEGSVIRRFVDFLGGDQAQQIIAKFGQNFSYSKSLLTTASETTFEPAQLLRGRL